MKPSNQPAGAMNAQLHWDEEGIPRSRSFDDVYYSKDNGLQESQYVFLQGNELDSRWQHLAPNTTFTIAETGFGTGLNFLAAWQLWRQSLAIHNHCRLHFISVEKFPLTYDDLKRALRLWPDVQELSDQLLAKYPVLPAKDFRRLHFNDDQVTLSLVLDDATRGLKQLLPIDKAGEKLSQQLPTSAYVDAWFLDGFAPAKNPEMWSEDLFKTIARLSNTATTLATFTVAGLVKRRLTQAGFNIKKKPGFGHKREMLCAHVETAWHPTPEHHKPDPSWHINKPAKGSSNRDLTNRDIAIIGAGLSGCHSAYAMAHRGNTVTVFDQNIPASGASGNAQGIVYVTLSHQQDVLARINLACWQYANQFYQDCGLYQEHGQQCGVLYMAANQNQRVRLRKVADFFQQSRHGIRWIDKHESHAITGIEQGEGGLYAQHSGWLSPPKVCRALLQHANIEVVPQTPITQLISDGQHWQLFSAGHFIRRFDCVVIANGADATSIDQTRYLPVKPIRGQISELHANQSSRQLKAVLCADRYVAPAINDRHCIGASFNLHNNNPGIDPADHQQNIASASKLCPPLKHTELLGGRVGFRATTPDYLPIVGAVAKQKPFITAFQEYRVNFNAKIDAPGHYYPNLYVLTGLGSRGLAYAPLCAELLANIMHHEPLALPRELMLHLHPARFLVRDLSRKRL